MFNFSSSAAKIHFKRIFNDQKKILLLLGILVFIFQFLYTLILSTSTIRKFAEAYFKLIPPMVKQIMGMVGESFVGSQFIAFGYTHPTILFIFSLVAISIASRYITAEIEGRSIELLALRIKPRSYLISVPFIFIILTQVGLFILMFTGSLTGRFFLGLHNEVPIPMLLKVISIGVLFFAALTAIITYISTLFNQRSKAVGWGIGFVLLSFVFDTIIRVWSKINFLKPFSFFNWYQPVNIATEKYHFIVGIPLLLTLLMLFIILALRHFNQRDL